MSVSVDEIKVKIEELLSTLIDMPVDVSETQKENSDATYCAFYGQQEASSACVLDLSLANSLGAALPRIHPSTAADATKENRTPDNIKENLDEILNVCTSILRNDQQNRIQLLDICPGQEIPDQHKPALDGNRVAFDVGFGSYETGVFSINLPG